MMFLYNIENKKFNYNISNSYSFPHLLPKYFSVYILINHYICNSLMKRREMFLHLLIRNKSLRRVPMLMPKTIFSLIYGHVHASSCVLPLALIVIYRITFVIFIISKFQTHRIDVLHVSKY